MKQYRTAIAQRVAEDPKYAQKHRARIAVVRAIKSGALVKPAGCSRCEATPPRRQIHAHHGDYTKPLAVEWLCATCHFAHHATETRRLEMERRARLKDKRFRLNPIPHD